MPKNVNEFFKQTYGINFYDENDIYGENCDVKIDWAGVIFIGSLIFIAVIGGLILSII